MVTGAVSLGGIHIYCHPEEPLCAVYVPSSRQDYRIGGGPAKSTMPKTCATLFAMSYARSKSPAAMLLNHLIDIKRAKKILTVHPQFLPTRSSHIKTQMGAASFASTTEPAFYRANTTSVSSKINLDSPATLADLSRHGPVTSSKRSLNVLSEQPSSSKAAAGGLARPFQPGNEPY